MTEEAKTAEQRRGPGRPPKPRQEATPSMPTWNPPPTLDLDELASQLSETAQEPKGGDQDSDGPVPPEPRHTNLPALASEPERADTPAPEPYDPLREWAPMDTARRDGRPIWLTDGNGKTVEAVWRHSKQFTLRADATGRLVSRWYTHNFWAINNAGGQKVPWEPKGWRPIFA